MMRSLYDPVADLLYVTLRAGEVAHSETVGNRTQVDLDAAGRPVGIRISHPAQPWPVHEIIRRYNIGGGIRQTLEVLFSSQCRVALEGSTGCPPG